MAVLLCVCMILIPLAIGNGILSILYGKTQESTTIFADALLLGTVAVLGVTEAAHLSAVFAGFSFSTAVTIFAVLTALLFLASLFMVKVKNFRGRGEKISFFSILFGLVALSQVIYIAVGGGVYLRGDLTVETVESFLYTDGIYQVNPLTGAAFTEGMPFRLEILCLPTLYGALTRLSGLTTSTVVWTVVPLMTLLLCYCAFSCLGRSLFPEDRKKRECFMVAVALLLWAGGSLFGVDGFGVLYSGWRGVVIRNVVLMPYLLSLCIRKRWVAALLCIAAEACIVWTFYGAGACLFTAAAIMAASLAGRKLRRAGGEGAAK